jgi:transposase
MRRYELTDVEWERIEKYFPAKVPGTPGRPPNPHRPLINGIVWIARSGAPWRDLPERYGPWETVSLFRLKTG